MNPLILNNNFMQTSILNDFRRDRLFGKEITNVLDNKLLKNRNLSRKNLIMPRGISEENFRRNQSQISRVSHIPADHASRPNLTINPTLKVTAPKPKEVPVPVTTNTIYRDIQCVPDYFEENLDFMLQQEGKIPPLHESLQNQKSLNETMRNVLLDWILDAHLRFKMFPSTLFIAVNLIDRYLLLKEIPHSKLQLVGATCFFIASKYEETYSVPELSDMVSLCAKAFTKDEFLQMESNILKALDFSLIVESSHRFLEPLAKLDAIEGKALSICRYLLELSLFDLSILKHKPSLLASASIYLSNKFLKKSQLFGDHLVAASGYE